jgi:hypothetical protein
VSAVPPTRTSFLYQTPKSVVLAGPKEVTTSCAQAPLASMPMLAEKAIVAQQVAVARCLEIMLSPLPIGT